MKNNSGIRWDQTKDDAPCRLILPRKSAFIDISLLLPPPSLEMRKTVSLLRVNFDVWEFKVVLMKGKSNTGWCSLSETMTDGDKGWILTVAVIAS